MANDTPGSDSSPEGLTTGAHRPEPEASSSPYARPPEDTRPDGRHQAAEQADPGAAAAPGSERPDRFPGAQGGPPTSRNPAGPSALGSDRYPPAGPYGPGAYGYGYGSGGYGSGAYGSGAYGSGAYGSGMYGSGEYGSGEYGSGMYGSGTHRGANPPYPSPAGHGPPAAASGRPVHRGRAALALVAVLLAGLIGGVVGASLDGGGGGSRGVLGAPVPEIDPSAPLGPVEAVAQRVLPSVVRLLVEGGGAAGEGSGMVLSADGLMLTNNHVVEGAADGGSIVAVFQDGSTAPADIVGLDPTSDLAVIRARGVSGLTPIEFGNSDAVRVGQRVVAVGSPLGLGGTVTAGIISAVDRAVSVGAESGAAEATVLSALQTDAAINPGNSGGPLTDMQGRVIGINSVIATTGAQGGSIGVGFSIPINQARRTAQELEATGTATRAILGVNVNTGDPRGVAGAVLGPVVPGGPAEQAGLREGQVITRVEDRIITKGEDLVAAIREYAPGDRVTLVVDGRPITVTLTGESG